MEFLIGYGLVHPVRGHQLHVPPVPRYFNSLPARFEQGCRGSRGVHGFQGFACTLYQLAGFFKYHGCRGSRGRKLEGSGGFSCDSCSIPPTKHTKESNLAPCFNDSFEGSDRLFRNFSVLGQFSHSPFLEFVSQLFSGSFSGNLGATVKVRSYRFSAFYVGHVFPVFSSPIGKTFIHTVEPVFPAEVFGPHYFTHEGFHTCAVVNQDGHAARYS